MGFLLGLVLFVVGVFPFLSKFGLTTSVPAEVSAVLTSLPAIVIQIGFILGGIFLWLDASRRTRLFNGMISIIVGLICLFVGVYPFLVSKGIVSDFLSIPYNLYQYLLILLGLLLMYDSFGGITQIRK